MTLMRIGESDRTHHSGAEKTGSKNLPDDLPGPMFCRIL
jgi:hypothetical protein